MHILNFIHNSNVLLFLTTIFQTKLNNECSIRAKNNYRRWTKDPASFTMYSEIILNKLQILLQKNKINKITYIFSTILMFTLLHLMHLHASVTIFLIFF